MRHSYAKEGTNPQKPSRNRYELTLFFDLVAIGIRLVQRQDAFFFPFRYHAIGEIVGSRMDRLEQLHPNKNLC